MVQFSFYIITHSCRLLNLIRNSTRHDKVSFSNFNIQDPPRQVSLYISRPNIIFLNEISNWITHFTFIIKAEFIYSFSYYKWNKFHCETKMPFGKILKSFLHLNSLFASGDFFWPTLKHCLTHTLKSCVIK